ncbi:thiol:disulfide interchange protein [Polaribacter vadi]|jgi:hypothetical protein|uniref:Thiol:disulfide interchange protein n=1 Tax=Polaribacter vadi TaxID=1774273 RepID=A0A1B8TZP5_9FLAO|nr:DUF4369 domain-containing protein [Polaribacter vadi]AOW16027.1 thiol:disulfide interchange protein [Polaribacter vadi]OBY65064.1 thiol:disulfide interchange protein [Polaribacter vadi]|tara:strand:- start:98 stop:802 length:705 start_codon:yes stop_codon:yes gene_type:complete
MKKILAVLAISIILYSCSSKKDGNMIVEGQIKGLKKGKLYLQKMVDTVLVSVDSVALLGTDTFRLTDNVDSPVLYYLTFDGNTTDKRILFFGEAGTITINDKVELFGFNPEIKGSKNQELLDKYNLVSKKFQSQRLEFIKKDFDAKKANDKDLIQKLEADYQKMVKRRVLYTTNFALSNADTEVAPYIALTEMYDASLQMLDTVNNKLSPRVKESDYGKRFQEYLDNIKANQEK